MDKENKNQKNTPENKDDFEVISGIGASIAEALYQSGIYRFSELARFTSEDLADLLSARVAFVSAQRIENDDWLGQARTLASEQSIHTPETNWRELADFFVSFGETVDADGIAKIHTKVHHSQGDQSECWDGIVTEELIQWMLSHANLAQEPERDKNKWKKQIPVQDEDLVEEVNLEVSDLWISQVSVPVQDKPENTQSVVRVEGSLDFSGPDALSLTYEIVPFSIEIYLINKDDSHSRLATIYNGQTEPHELNYKFQQDFAIPKRGKYRICLKARLLHPFMAEVQTHGPILRVGV